MVCFTKMFTKIPASQNNGKWYQICKNQTMVEKRVSTLFVSQGLMANSCCFRWKASISSCILWLLYQSSHRKMLLIYAWKYLQFYTNAIRIKDFLCFFIASMVRFFLHLMSFLYLAGLKEVRIFYIQVLHLWVLAGYN